ncbi:YopX family protein [Staphylococcus simulans]|uniref:YopX family protein n=1 Tax=Staphylococcus simulans TaxID=1286 RepID=UPI001E4FC273|nr:YopX family protein [Staphylococcus simulans]MCD8916348.1 YopX family protein [Staphylococcus simulans]
MIAKFRAWDKQEQTIKKVTSICFDGNAVVSIGIVPEGEHAIKAYPSKDFKIMQSTGLNDIDGEEIYESDIVRNSYGELYVVEWLDGSFVLTEFYNGGYDHYIIDSSTDYEVLGNIYEKPELLERDSE